jgi:hypothetical protein
MAAGAVLRGEVSVLGRDDDRLATSAGPMHARWIIDASGVAGARLLAQPTVKRQHLCAAAQEVREVTDRAAAEAFFARNGVATGEVLGLIGVAGGYSVLNLRLHHGGATMGILTGSIPSLGFPSGKTLLDEFVRDHAWVGQRVFGGSGAIPLCRAHDRLADDRVALLGDAACQVFPAHGSGVGAGLLAARLLADTLAGGGSLRDYEVAWQRRHGGLFAFFDVFRRWNQNVDGETSAGRSASGWWMPRHCAPGSIRCCRAHRLARSSARHAHSSVSQRSPVASPSRWRVAPPCARCTRAIRVGPSGLPAGDVGSTGCSASRHGRSRIPTAGVDPAQLTAKTRRPTVRLSARSAVAAASAPVAR